jgi:hypothetical protein
MANLRACVGLIGWLAIALPVPLLAQPIPPDSIADKEMGWIKVYNFPPATEPLKVDTRVYSAAQRTVAVDLANWMQASYSPLGGLGEVVRTFPKTGPAVPQSYGVIGHIYNVLKYGANRKIELYTTDGFSWNVMANGSFGEASLALSTPEHYYFTIPTFAEQGFGEELEKAVDLSGHPFLRRFPGWFQRNSVNGNRKFVLLSKDARLPFVKLTRGEYLDAVEAAITQAYAREKKRITEAEQGDQVRIARYFADYEQRTAKRREVLAANRAKYKDRLQEVAEIWTVQPDIMLENFPDVFEGNGGNTKRLPVYTVDAATLERCKTGPPQWIVVSWTGQLNEPVVKHLHDAVVTQFNFEYIYNRYFDPEKVKGLPYTPLRPARPETVAADASAASKTLAADPDVHFFEDFSTTPVGKKPLNWHSTLNNAGASSVVSELTGLQGHWASVTGFTVTPTQVKGPLPRDFSVSFDLVATRDYTWGARSMMVKLSKGVAQTAEESYFTVRFRPGFGGRDGEATVEGRLPGASPGYFSGTKYAAVPGFSNNQQNNRIAVTIRKHGEMVQLFIGQTRVAEYPKALPEGLLFDAVSFHLQGQQPSPNDQMFISNVKIVKGQ